MEAIFAESGNDRGSYGCTLDGATPRRGALPPCNSIIDHSVGATVIILLINQDFIGAVCKDFWTFFDKIRKFRQRAPHGGLAA